MTHHTSSNFRKLNGHLLHLALEVEAKVNDARRNHFEELVQKHRLTGKEASKWHADANNKSICN